MSMVRNQGEGGPFQCMEAAKILAERIEGPQICKPLHKPEVLRPASAEVDEAGAQVEHLSRPALAASVVCLFCVAYDFTCLTTGF